MQRGWLVNDGSDTVSFDNAPNEESDARDGNYGGFQGEEVAAEIQAWSK